MRVVVGKWTQAVAMAAVVFAVFAGTAGTPGAQATAGGQDPGPKKAAQPQPAGASVLTGAYTDEQAKRGEAASNKLCTSCHGPDLSGGEAGPTLVGAEFVATWTGLSAADFYDRVHATMPADAPCTMTPQQTSDVTAYVLKLNKYPAGQTELPTDVAALKNIMIEGQPTK